MALSFIGHSPSFEIWVFNVNGRELVTRNFSTQSPLQLKFAGAFDKYSGSVPLINTSGFNITESTDKVIVWTWGGKQYTSYWVAESDDIDDPDANVTLFFGPAVPYSGPPTAPVGNGGVTNTQSPPPASIPAIVPSLPIDTGLVSEFRDTIDNANRALAVSEAQRKVDINALNSARVEIEAAKQMLAEAQAKATRDQEMLLAQMAEKLQEMQERADIQINIARQMLAQQAQQPPVTSPVVTSPVVTSPVVTSPVVITPTTTTTAPSGTDWVKLGLQLGAAYLILS
jgi:hypothetical protein